MWKRRPAAGIGKKLDDLVDRQALHDIRNCKGFLISAACADS
jgi:hypothetical protein